MTIEKGQPWGTAGSLAPDAPVFDHDRAAGRFLSSCLAELGTADPPEFGLTGGDLHRSLGAPRHSGDDLRAGTATRFPIDVAILTTDAGTDVAVAHLVATADRRGRLWHGRSVVVVNGSFVGDFDLGPRAHPNDGRLDLTDGALPPGQRRAGRRRARTGTHLPHPDLRARRVTEYRFGADADAGPGLVGATGESLYLRIDGDLLGRVTTFSVRCLPDAAIVVV